MSNNIEKYYLTYLNMINHYFEVQKYEEKLKTSKTE